jgi:hypothetical protein
MEWMPSLSRLVAALALLAAFVGCGTSRSSSSLPPAPIEWDGQEWDGQEEFCAVHDVHPSRGPHQGTLLEFGQGAYHAELVHDDANYRVGIYLLDSRAVRSVPVGDGELTVNVLVGGKPTQFRLPPAPLAGESPRNCSHFELQCKLLCDALKQPDGRPRFNVNLRGKHYVVQIDHGRDQVAQWWADDGSAK